MKKEERAVVEIASFATYDDYYQKAFGRLPAKKTTRWMQRMTRLWRSFVLYVTGAVLLGAVVVFAGTRDPMLDERCARVSTVNQMLQFCLTECRAGKSELFNTSTVAGLAQCETYCRRDAVILVQQECRIR